MGFDWIVLAAFAGYLALMLGIGFAFSRRQESLGDYYLGGDEYLDGLAKALAATLG